MKHKPGVATAFGLAFGALLLIPASALHGEQGTFSALFPGHGLGSATLQDSLIAFNPIVTGTIV